MWMKCSEWSIIYWGYKYESCCFLSVAHQTDLTPKIFSVVAPCSMADMHQHFRVPAISIIRVMEAAGSSQTMLHNYRLTVAGPRWQATSFSPLWESQISFYMILNKSRPKSDWYETVNSGLCMWVIWLSGCLYKSEGVVCLWSSSELLTTVTCLSCWDVSGL